MRKFLCTAALATALILTLPAYRGVSHAAPGITDYLGEYEAITFSSYDGLISSEINAVTQTGDGYIWTGTYSGLYRYDGHRFEHANLDDRISSIMALYSDKKGHLWIGTNDSGLCCYNRNTESTTFYTTGNGLAADAIRSMAQDSSGNLYVGTVSYMTIIDRDGNARILDSSDDITGVKSLTFGGNGIVAGVTNGGLLFFLKNGELIEGSSESIDIAGIYYNSVESDGNGSFIAGTSGNVIERFHLEDGHKVTDALIETKCSYFNRILYYPSKKEYFFCAENGLGCISSEASDKNDMIYLMQDRFDSSISDVTVDYQDNIWFVSNKQGIIEYSKNPFIDLFSKAGLSSSVVNSLLVSGDEIFIAMDNGLAILDSTTFQQKRYTYIKGLKDVRIRHIMKDTKGNIWLSTYGKDGLVKIAPGGKLKSFNEDNAGTAGGRFRLTLDLSGGTVLAASNIGLSYIEDDMVTCTITAEDGLPSAQILSMVRRPDGSVLAGSDGEGIAVIKDRKVVDTIDTEDGLDTLVVLRIIPVEEGYIYVTSNALYYDDGNSIKKLDKFPYNNNYDVYISPKDEAWISSSAGIYVVKVSDLIENGSYNYTLLDNTRGFDTTLTANAWNCLLPPDDDLLLCCTDGARIISTARYNSFRNDYSIRIGSFTCDDTPLAPEADGSYIIPAGVERIEIMPAIMNYTLSNPPIHMYLQGAKDDGVTVNHRALVPLTYTSLPNGRYTLHIQVLGNTEHTVLRDETYLIEKKALFTETILFRILSVLIVALAVGFFVWRFMQTTIIRRQYAQIREAKDEAERANSAKSRFLANMSHEIRTPINTIMGMDEMILREDRTEPVEKYSAAVAGYAVSIKRASESLLTLVNDILDLSKIESGKMNLVEQEYDLTELLRSITTMIRVRSNEKDLGFTTHIDPEIPSVLYGDPGKIKQVLLNLLTNAVKYTEKGSFELKLSQLSNDGEFSTIEYSVSDTGIGIRPEDMDKLFSAFERLDEKRNSGIQGTGLGLDISRQFVELMGDSLKVESVYGEGSTFHFTLKQKIVDSTHIGEFTENNTDETGGRYIPLFIAPDARILVVDDNEMNLQVLSGLIKGTKVQLDKAMSGKECLSKLSSSSYHMIFLDHMMPGMDGIETLHKLRETNPDIPVVALTANAANDGGSFYISEGFQGYLAKPVDGRKLEECMKSFLPEDLLQEPELSSDDNGEEAVPADHRLSLLGDVEGINLSEGVKNCGTGEAFLSAITTFHENLPDRAAEIEDAYNREDWQFYTIKVHALKSSARIIGATALSELAMKMEDAGKSGDIDAIKQNTDHLLSLYRSYTDRLAVLSEGEEDEDDSSLPEADPGTIAEAYEALSEMVPQMDYESVEMVLNDMSEFRLPAEEKERFKALEKYLKALDWDSMKELLAGR